MDGLSIRDGRMVYIGWMDHPYGIGEWYI
jgi:hypothetical protein